MDRVASAEDHRVAEAEAAWRRRGSMAERRRGGPGQAAASGGATTRWSRRARSGIRAGPIAGPEQVGRQGVGGVLAGLDQARLAEELPMFPLFRPRLVAEVRPAVDRYDPDPAAVRALVLARAATPPKVRGARRSGREEAREGRAWGAR